MGDGGDSRPYSMDRTDTPPPTPAALRAASLAKACSYNGGVHGFIVGAQFIGRWRRQPPLLDGARWCATAYPGSALRCIAG